MKSIQEKLLDYSKLNITEISEMQCPLDRSNFYPDSQSASLRYAEEVNNIVTWIKKKRQEVSGQSEQ